MQSMRITKLALLYTIFNCLFISSLKAQSKVLLPDLLFSSDSLLKITLSGNISDLLNDRTNNPAYHSLSVYYSDSSGKEFSLSAEAKTRGHFRKLKGNCNYPPLIIHFLQSDTLNNSVFRQQSKLKLVMPCSGDKYVVYEWLAYKLYNIITPKSFNARLVNVTLIDSKKKKTTAPFFGILLEDENEMAKRNSNIVINRQLQPGVCLQDDFLKMTMFEYMIGNTDWSVQYLQNIKLITKDSTQAPSTVPYDFDHAGIISAPYAQPAEELQMSSVRERRYRGYCMQNLYVFDSTIALYNRVKPAVYNLYTSCAYLDKQYVRLTLKYLNDFYATINNAVAFKKDFSYPCDRNGTGNVVIKGLKD